MSRRGPLYASVWVWVAFISACSQAPLGETLSNSSGSLPIPLDAMSVNQRPALEDGIVELAEYRAAFEAFASCLEIHGVPAGGITVDPRTGLIDYGVHERLGTPTQPTSTESGRCYDSTFSWIEYVFQTTDPAVNHAAIDEERQLFVSTALPCLIASGAVVSPDAVVGTEEFDTAMAQWRQLEQHGKC